MPNNGSEHIQVVGQTPVGFVVPGLGRKIGWVYEKYDARSVVVSYRFSTSNHNLPQALRTMEEVES